MMKAILLRLAAPMQSWGTQSRFSERDTQLEPSKSGVIGILGAALGRPRDADLSDLAALKMATRVDREGRKLKDFHTIGGGSLPADVLKPYGVKCYGFAKANGAAPDTALSTRYYLADARFLVALGSPEPAAEALLGTLAEALRSPVNQIFLGRKSFVPTEPVLHDPDEPLRSGESLRSILEAEPWFPQEKIGKRSTVDGRPPADGRLRLIVEAPFGQGQPRSDVPMSFVKGKRQFGVRYVRTEFIAEPVALWNKNQPGKERAA